MVAGESVGGNTLAEDRRIGIPHGRKENPDRLHHEFAGKVAEHLITDEDLTFVLDSRTYPLVDM